MIKQTIKHCYVIRSFLIFNIINGDNSIKNQDMLDKSDTYYIIVIKVHWTDNSVNFVMKNKVFLIWDKKFISFARDMLFKCTFWHKDKGIIKTVHCGS